MKTARTTALEHDQFPIREEGYLPQNSSTCLKSPTKLGLLRQSPLRESGRERAGKSVGKMSLSDEAERALQSVAVLRSGKLENRRARIRFARQAEGLGFNLVADVQILDS